MQTNETHTQLSRQLSRKVARQQGMTLIEIMIVVIIMAMISSGVAIAVMKNLKDAQIKQTKTDVRAVRTAAFLFRANQPRKCPDVRQLREEGYLEKNAREKDPWDTDFVVNCSDLEIDVYSFGPDLEEHTDDDIH